MFTGITYSFVIHLSLRRVFVAFVLFYLTCYYCTCAIFWWVTKMCSKRREHSVFSQCYVEKAVYSYCKKWFKRLVVKLASWYGLLSLSQVIELWLVCVYVHTVTIERTHLSLLKS